jgi:hypothetical protein
MAVYFILFSTFTPNCSAQQALGGSLKFYSCSLHVSIYVLGGMRGGGSVAGVLDEPYSQLTPLRGVAIQVRQSI